jgi:hypothetical protein
MRAPDDAVGGVPGLAATALYGAAGVAGVAGADATTPGGATLVLLSADTKVCVACRCVPIDGGGGGGAGGTPRGTVGVELDARTVSVIYLYYETNICLIYLFS